MLNHITIQGNLTRDPEIQTLPSGDLLAKGGIAHNHRFRRKDGETQEETTFLDFTLFRKQAETFAQYFFKGDQVILEGRLRQENWETDGQKRSKLGLIVDRFHFVGKKGDEQ